MSLPMRQAASFADAAMRRVLEVIDRRRPIAQLNGLLAAGLVDSVLSANRLIGSQNGVAVLRRVRLQAVNGPNTAAEVFGSYSRGQRMHAIACRIEQVRRALAGGRAAHRLGSYLRLALACLPCRRAASRRSRREPPPACDVSPLPCTCAEPSSAGPV